MNKTSYSVIVKEVCPELMDGSDELERKLNAYLTKAFIGSANLPSNECLQEARDVLEIVQLHDEGESI